MKLQHFVRAAATGALVAGTAVAGPVMPPSTAQPFKIVSRAQAALDHGRVAAAQQQTITVFLKLRDQAGFDQAVSELYDPQSPRFHHWFEPADFARYAPSAADVQAVKAGLQGQGLEVVSIDPQNFSLRVRGASHAMETAFQTELHSYSRAGADFQAPLRQPRLAGAAGALIAATVGLERHQAHPQFAAAKNPLTGKPLFQQKMTSSSADLGVFNLLTSTPLSGPQQFNLKALAVPLPTNSLYGPAYAINFFKFVSYTPADLQRHYGLDSLIAQGYDGRGQTIALVEAFGYDAALADANTAVSVFGGPPLDASNFQVIYPEGKPLNPSAADLTGWNGEIALDIQAAHAVAPGAKIVEVASSGQDNEDQIASLEYIINHRVATIVSCSWENDPEIISGAEEEQAFNNVLERSAAAGISVNFATGDSGDLGLGTPLGSVSIPSNSPYATAVGGTSVLNDPLGGPDIVTGWGSNLSLLETIAVIYDPPVPQGFAGGGGGGESQYYAKPVWQHRVPGTGRQVPDVAALGDPYTGVPVVVTTAGEQDGLAGIGGTSLATPVFSAIWAIAQQYNREVLGQAAPAIARLGKGQITDVVDTSDLSQYNLSGTITDDNGATAYKPTDYFNGSDPAIAQTNYLVAITPLPGSGFHNAFAITFGGDTSLTSGPGWDNVTGFGEPNGLPFIRGVGGPLGHSCSMVLNAVAQGGGCIPVPPRPRPD